MNNKQDVANKIAAVFQANLGNRITVELANGMIQEVVKLIPQIGEEDVNATTADPSTKE